MNTKKNQSILDFFKKAVQTKRLAHGYLFWGPEFSGKKDIAFWLAELLKTNNFDVLYIYPKEKIIILDQIKKIKKHISLSSYNSEYKFVIIDKAETMNTESANALLKTLEEPQKKNILILITSRPNTLPKTIISRLQNIRFSALPLDKISKKFIKEEYTNILQKPLNDIFKDIERISKDNFGILVLLDSWLFWFREKMLIDNEYTKKVKEIQKTKNLISNTNINTRLALENLVLKLYV